MKRIVLFLISIVLVLTFAGCGSEEKELTNRAVYENYTLVIGEAVRFTDENGTKMLKVHAVYTNSGKESQYAASSFAVRAFQNDKELEQFYNVGNEDDNITKEVQNGASVNVIYYFALSDSSEVEILVGEPTAEMKSIGRRIYTW